MNLFYAVKITDIVYITVLYFVFGYYIAKLTDTITEYIFGKDDLKTKPRLVFEIVFQILLSFSIAYFGKKIIDRIPFPLEGVAGFTHYKLKEFIQNGGAFWAIGMLFYEKRLKDKILIFKKYIN